jgi:hypothetical protein
MASDCKRGVSEFTRRQIVTRLCSGEEAEMRRVSIRGLMAAVILVALDCVAVRVYNEEWRRWPDFGDLAVFGLLPMANILILAALALRADPSGPRRPFLIGFLACGWTGWLLTLAAAVVAMQAIHEGIGGALRPVQFFLPLFVLMASLTLLAPQLVLAILGGRYSHRRAARTRQRATA